MDRITLDRVAQMGMDMYFRDYAPESAFFNLDDFKLLACSTYAKLFNDDFQAQKTQNRNIDMFSYADMTASFLLSEEIEIQEREGIKFAQTKLPLFAFLFDSMSSAIESITKIKDCPCGEIIKISNRDKWKLKHVPSSKNIYYYLMGDLIEFPSLSCNPGKLRINYLPALLPDNDACNVPEFYVITLITTVLQIMFGAKNENIIDMSNDSNPNVNEITESDPNLLKTK
jgi:hypothetical protein